MGGNRRSTGGLTGEAVAALLETFGARVHQRRTALGMTAKDLAAAIDLSSPSVYNIEHGIQGPVSVLTLDGLCRALDCSADWLLGR